MAWLSGSTGRGKDCPERPSLKGGRIAQRGHVWKGEGLPREAIVGRGKACPETPSLKGRRIAQRGHQWGWNVFCTPWVLFTFPLTRMKSTGSPPPSPLVSRRMVLPNLADTYSPNLSADSHNVLPSTESVSVNSPPSPSPVTLGRSFPSL